jgi:hypothetical protein
MQINLFTKNIEIIKKESRKIILTLFFCSRMHVYLIYY